jgi:hypothetical protein
MNIDHARAARMFDFSAPEPQGEAPQFGTPEFAWFWAMLPENFGTYAAADIWRVVERLHRQRRIDLAHARILRVYGELGRPPSYAQRDDSRLWREAMALLGEQLRLRGIVRGDV